MPKLVLQFLGQFQVTLDERPISAFESDKVRALLAYLAVETDRPHSRSELAALLWSGYSEESARTNLRQALRQLRLTIADETATPPFLQITRQSLQFNPAAYYRLDVATFTTLLRESATRTPTCSTVRLACNVCKRQLLSTVATFWPA